MADVLDLFTKEEAARKLRVSTRTLDRLTEEGKLFRTKIGRKVFFTAKQLNNAIERGTA